MRRNLRPEDLGDFLAEPRCATLATRFKNGTILMSPVWHEWTDGGFTVVAVRDDVKVRHVERDPNVSICLAEDAPPYRGIEVRGVARLVHANRETADATMRRIAVRYLGTEQGENFCASLSSVELVLLRMIPGTLRVWDFADEPALAGSA